MGKILLLSLKKQRFHLLLLFALLLVSFCGAIYAAGMTEAKKNIFRRWEKGLDYHDHDVYNIVDSNIDRNMFENEPWITKAWADSITELREMGLIDQAGSFMYENIEDPRSIRLKEDEFAKITYFADYLSMVHTDLSEGSLDPLFSHAEDKPVPALISPALKEQEHLSCGDKYQGPDGCLYSVAGVLHPESMVFWGTGSPVVLSLRKIKSRRLIIVASPDEYGDSRFCQAGIIIPSETADRTVFCDTVTQIFKKNNIDINCDMTLEELEQYSLRSTLPYRLRKAAFFLMILFLSLMGLTGNTMAVLNERHEEFGIYLTLGWSKHSLYLLVLLEIGLLFITAFAAAALVMTIYFRLTYIDPDVALGISWVLMNGRILAAGTLIMLFSTLFSLLMPFLKVKKLSAIELIREKE